MNPKAVVLAALSGAAVAQPEADPQVILNAAPFAPAGLLPGAYNGLINPLNTVINPYAALPLGAATPLPAIIPQQPAIVPAPIAPVVSQTVVAPAAVAAPVLARAVPSISASPFRAGPATRVVTPAGIHGFSRTDCVTEEGCQVLALKEAGLAKREATAEAEADPQVYYNNAVLPGVYSGLNNGLYNGLYNNLGLGALSPNFYGALPYNYYNYAATAPLAPAVAPAVLPAVRAALPNPVVRAPAVVKALPAPLPAVRALPAPVVAPVVARAPVKVVETRAKPVTYTHIGAHPVQPTTVLKTETREYLV